MKLKKSDVREFIPHAKGFEKRSLSIVFGFEFWESVPLVWFCRVLNLPNLGKTEVPFFSGLESLEKWHGLGKFENFYVNCQLIICSRGILKENREAM